MQSIRNTCGEDKDGAGKGPLAAAGARGQSADGEGEVKMKGERYKKEAAEQGGPSAHPHMTKVIG